MAMGNHIFYSKNSTYFFSRADFYWLGCGTLPKIVISNNSYRYNGYQDPSVHTEDTLLYKDSYGQNVEKITP